MDSRSRRKVIRSGNLLAAKNSDFLPRGVSSPPNGGAPSSSVENSKNKPEDEQSGGDSSPDDLVVAKLLKQLKEPASVPEDESSRNKQQQDDEIVALEAIYEGAFRALCDDCFMIEVPIELAAETVEIALEQPSASSPSPRPFYTFDLEFLPPIHFGFSFPRTYPSRSPPVFVLECQWLSPDQLLLISDHLLHIWEETKGEVIVYPWSEFIHSRALRFLGASKRLVLEHSTLYQLDHPRIISGGSSQQSTAALLIGYNDEMRQKTFLSSLHMCNICFTEYTGRDFIRLSCQHLFCRSCMEKHAALHVAEGTVRRLICPSCPEPISPYVLKKLLGEAEFERWERLLLQKTLDSMRDVVYCPRCETACIQDLGDAHAQCDRCFYSFCGACRQNWHAGRRCLAAEQQLILLEGRGRRSDQNRASDEQARKEKRMMDELKSIKLVQQDSKQCPYCSMGIFKTGGCDNMICSNCGESFNFGSEKFVDFRSSRGTSDNSGTNIGMEHALFWEREFPGKVRVCPACGKRTIKTDNNNHICCTSCQSHYCGVCLKIVRKASEHFGPSKCRQHTADVR